MIDRRTFTLLSCAMALTAGRANAQMSQANAFAFSFRALDGGIVPLAQYAGHPILIVNTASKCGYTPQYAGLQELWERYRSRGLVIIAVPSNDFGGQEPGGASEIRQTAQAEYKITFPIGEKAVVKGAEAHPFYRWAAALKPTDVPRWNFHKYLIGRDGSLKASFASAVEPTDPRIISAIEAALGPA
ncbi:MAG: glutathione peroxidase [Pseudolabrys sp.]|nr:glutathione peroxidase [Pseudolabrys sp.]MBV9955149.1 glutathione peroxidase [Pseudolabrys sp.]